MSTVRKTGLRVAESESWRAPFVDAKGVVLYRTPEPEGVGSHLHLAVPHTDTQPSYSERYVRGCKTKSEDPTTRGLSVVFFAFCQINTLRQGTEWSESQDDGHRTCMAPGEPQCGPTLIVHIQLHHKETLTELRGRSRRVVPPVSAPAARTRTRGCVLTRGVRRCRVLLLHRSLCSVRCVPVLARVWV